MGAEVPRRFVRFKQADIKRAAKGLSDAGVHDFRIEIDPNGKMVILAGQAAAVANDTGWEDFR